MQISYTTLDQHLDDIVRVGYASFPHFYTPQVIRERLVEKKSWIAIAQEKLSVPRYESQPQIIGFKIWYEDTDGQIYSWLGAVHPSYRRRGIASALMQAQIDQARSDGYERITLKTHEGHPEMIALSKKFGFQELRREPHHWHDERTAIFLGYEIGEERIHPKQTHST